MYTVLIVDDEKDILEIISEYAKNEGYNILKAQNGSEALKIFNQNKINIVILDIMLPDISGYEIFRMQLHVILHLKEY